MRRFFTSYVKGTAYKADVINRTRLMCRLSPDMSRDLDLKNDGSTVNISSRCLKHLFDKKPAEEFLFLIDHIYEVLKFPEKVYANKTEKRGSLCFVKKIAGFEYFCAIEPKAYNAEIATAFRLRDQKYLRNYYTLLWSWKDGVPSS